MIIFSVILFLGSAFFLIGMRVFLGNQPTPEESNRYENLGYLFAVFLAVSAAIIAILSPL